MMSTLPHKPRILLVDDQPAVLEAVTFRLRTRGYTVLTANTAAAALERIANDIFHLAIVDVCLADQYFRTDTQGFAVVKALPANVPCIVYTAYEQATSAQLVELGAKTVVDKRASDAAVNLLAAVDHCFAKESPLKLDLQVNDDLNLALVAQQLEPASAGPAPTAEDIAVILQRFFVNAQSVELTPLLNPENAATQAQSGAVLLRAQEVRQGGKTAPVVVKLSRRAAIEEEAARYELLKPYVGGHHLARLEQTAYSRQTGGLIYTLVGTSDWQALRTLSEILCLQDDTAAIVEILASFFQNTFAEIHQAAQPATFSLYEHYITGLGLTTVKLNRALHQLYPPALSQAELDLAALCQTDDGSLPHGLINPVHWAMERDDWRRDAPGEYLVCLAHGDLHTRNILSVNAGWLILVG
jgi:CheY-like chemotaxis protein